MNSNYCDSEPTQYANHLGGSAEAYSEYPIAAEAGTERVAGPQGRTQGRKWPMTIMLAGLVLVTGLLVAFVISTMVKFGDSGQPTPSVVITNPVTTVVSGGESNQNTPQTSAVAPTGATGQPATTTRAPESVPATMTNPLEPAPATMTNPLEPAPATMTNPLEPAPATMTNPLEPAPATMTNPLEPGLIGSSGSEG